MKIKNSAIIKISLLLAVVGLSLAPVAAIPPRSVHPALIARARQVTGDNFVVTATTPRRVTIVARKTPRPEVLRAIDQGFSDLFAVSRRNGYRARLNFSDYTVFIGRADRVRDSGGQYSPDIAVGA